MKKIIYLFCLLFAFSVKAQMSGMRNQRQIPQAQTTPKAPEFNVERYVGLVEYDIEKAAKKSSIKLSSSEGKKFSALLTNYNKEINAISRINSFTMRSTKEMVESFQNKALESGDFSNQQKVQKKMVENLKPLAETIREEDKKLNTEIKALLTKKQYEKWVKYNRKIYKSVPKDEK